MFPNPHDALPLPPRPSIEHYKKRAKDLLKAACPPEPAALLTWAADWIDSLLRLSIQRKEESVPATVISSEMAGTRSAPAAQSRTSPEQPTAGRASNGDLLFSGSRHQADQLANFAREKLSEHRTLTAAQFVIARAHGFESWPRLTKHIESLSRADSASEIVHFERAVDAIVTGDASTLARLLRDHPSLIRAHSTRRHHAMLLHYVAANGVENYRQKTPNNIVAIAKLLLASGADVNATAGLYGGSTTLGLVATSVHPERAGIQNALLQLLLDHGADIDGGQVDGAKVDEAKTEGKKTDGAKIDGKKTGEVKPDRGNSPALLVNICLANGRRSAAEFLADHGAPLDLEAAAGLGRLDLVKTLFPDSGSMSSRAADHQKERALCWACEYGHPLVVDFLLSRGVPIQSPANTGQTPLHWAVIGAQTETITLLLSRGADLEAKNMYGGTALGQALWSAAHSDSSRDYHQIAALLKLHGAKSE